MTIKDKYDVPLSLLTVIHILTKKKKVPTNIINDIVIILSPSCCWTNLTLDQYLQDNNLMTSTSAVLFLFAKHFFVSIISEEIDNIERKKEKNVKSIHSIPDLELEWWQQRH